MRAHSHAMNVVKCRHSSVQIQGENKLRQVTSEMQAQQLTCGEALDDDRQVAQLHG